MKLITRDTDYAIRALCFMAENENGVTSVSELVQKLKIPGPFLRKILQALNKKGVLASFKGKSGGFKLRRKPKEIFITDLIEVFQGPLKLNRCIFKKKLCPSMDKCILKKRIGEIEQRVVSELGLITVASLLRRGKNGEIFK
ncbi:MAG: Rrf2 family transcriptional regulator [Nitrospinae bacterium]|nr:Rrf2 family transcriptional regulator [Nitrospinota bacterium]